MGAHILRPAVPLLVKRVLLHELEEVGVAVGEGYQFAVLRHHDADVETLVHRVRSLAETEIARRYLEPASHRAGWVVGEDDEVAGRLVWNDEGDNGSPTTWSSTGGR